MTIFPFVFFFPLPLFAYAWVVMPVPITGDQQPNKQTMSFVLNITSLHISMTEADEQTCTLWHHAAWHWSGIHFAPKKQTNKQKINTLKDMKPYSKLQSSKLLLVASHFMGLSNHSDRFISLPVLSSFKVLSLVNEGSYCILWTVCLFICCVYLLICRFICPCRFYPKRKVDLFPLKTEWRAILSLNIIQLCHVGF